VVQVVVGKLPFVEVVVVEVLVQRFLVQLLEEQILDNVLVLGLEVVVLEFGELVDERHNLVELVEQLVLRLELVVVEGVVAEVDKLPFVVVALVVVVVG
jgi:hypothetical protein